MPSRRSAKKVGRGRPQLYPLSEEQENSIRYRIQVKKQTSAVILKAMPSVHPFALLRVRRALRG